MVEGQASTPPISIRQSLLFEPWPTLSLRTLLLTGVRGGRGGFPRSVLANIAAGTEMPRHRGGYRGSAVKSHGGRADDAASRVAATADAAPPDPVAVWVGCGRVLGKLLVRHLLEACVLTTFRALAAYTFGQVISTIGAGGVPYSSVFARPIIIDLGLD
jgi:hypothetical protein